MHFVEANGIRTACEITGEGEPLLLIHGAEADRTMFHGLIAALGDSFKTIAYDQRDSGATENPPIQYSLADLADDAAGVISGLGYDRAHVLGTSFGGLVAQVLAARHPHRIDRLILCSTWRVNRSPFEFNPEVFGKLSALRSDMAANAREIAGYFFTEEYLRRHPESVDIFRGNKRTEQQRARRGAALAQPASSDLSGFERPTLVIASTEDRLIPCAVTLAIADDLASARKATIGNAGHVSVIEAPSVIAGEIRQFVNVREPIAALRQ
jgi:3-oxoadipate enol-lactonase